MHPKLYRTLNIYNSSQTCYKCGWYGHDLKHKCETYNNDEDKIFEIQELLIVTCQKCKAFYYTRPLDSANIS